MTKWIALFAFALLPAGLVSGQAVNGELTANGGKRVTLTNVAAYEVDSASEKGYMDVVVVLSDRRAHPRGSTNHRKTRTTCEE